MTQQETKEKILLAAINAIEKNGIHNVTTRVIADEAGVNNAALHYYYGTKEQLVEAALRTTIEHWVADTAELVSTQSTLEARIRAILNYLLDGVLRFPNVIRAHLQQAFLEGDADSPFIDLLSGWLEQAYTGLEPDLDPDQKTKIRLAMQSALFSLLLTGLLPETSRLNDGLSLHDENFRDTYEAFLIESILHSTE